MCVCVMGISRKDERYNTTRRPVFDNYYGKVPEQEEVGRDLEELDM